MAEPRPTTRTAGSERVLIHNADHGIASLGSVMVQVRRGVMTMELLEAIAGFARASRVIHRGVMASLSILEEGAPMPAPEVRKRQGEIILSLLSDPSARNALVICGQGTLDAVRRATMRVTSQPKASQVRLFETPALAVGWLSQGAGVESAALLALVERLRRPP